MIRIIRNSRNGKTMWGSMLHYGTVFSGVQQSRAAVTTTTAASTTCRFLMWVRQPRVSGFAFYVLFFRSTYFFQSFYLVHFINTRPLENCFSVPKRCGCKKWLELVLWSRFSGRALMDVPSRFSAIKENHTRQLCCALWIASYLGSMHFFPF